MILENQELINNIQTQNIFYRAVVEDNDDSKEPGGTLGRCKVRIVGIHPEDNTKVPTADLPWAELMGDLGFHGGMSGYGVSAVPVKGSWVWVFFDGGDWNKPVIIGLVKGVSKKASEGKGFQDPDKKYPDKKRLNEPDINRYASNRKIASDTLIGKIKDKNRDKGIPTVTGKVWNEPKEATSSAKYPNNTVFETVNGSFVEFDETQGSRIHFFHNSGTYFEMGNKGDYAIKITRDHYIISGRDTYRLNKRDEYHTVRGNQEYKVDGEQNIAIGGKSTEYFDKDVKKILNAKKDEEVKGKVNEKYKSGQVTDGGPSIKIKAGVINLN